MRGSRSLLSSQAKIHVLIHIFPEYMLSIIIIKIQTNSKTNSEKSRNFKEEKYKYIERDCVRKFKKVEKIFIEITTLGMITKHISSLNKPLKDCDVNYDRMIAKCIEVDISASFYIDIRRHKS